MQANKLDIRGRIYISAQGLNAQFGGTSEHALQYVTWLKDQQLWKVCTARMMMVAPMPILFGGGLVLFLSVGFHWLTSQPGTARGRSTGASAHLKEVQSPQGGGNKPS
eukprot:1158975-Pelagomonas_calceolata.AAC.29